MPVFIPESPCFNGNYGEEKIFNLLKKLPDDCIVCHELDVQDRRPDFIVFSPRLGILIIEVKSWNISTIINGDQNILNIKNRHEHLGESKPVTHPIKQSNNYLYRLRDKLLNDLNVRELVNPDNSPYRGRLVFPLAGAIALTNITKQQLHEHSIQKSNGYISELHTLFKDELDLLNDVNDMDLESKLKRFFKPSWQFSLSDRQQALVRAMLSREPVAVTELVVVAEPVAVTELVAVAEPIAVTELVAVAEPFAVTELVAVAEPDEAKIKNVVDSILQHYFSLETEKCKKSQDVSSLQNEISLINEQISPEIDNNDFINQHREVISRLVSNLGQGINNNTAHDADELYSRSKAIKLKAEEEMLRSSLHNIERNQQVLKSKLARLASILEVEIA
ncbi:Nuclease-related domain-containing protein [Thiothrix caldifontis]|uniref:Nuclease-related domain-containing protein n=1 Tax=Thiothrix caldifontis TaxID=525918 RepID=A0A1H4ATG1_9GAMM|nr:nuclease-related domain-containing protein [Thiothrix caldifontis]SEA39183.1 Nuclease-related domain-containing protein [Thiothrix caldifontis]